MFSVSGKKTIVFNLNSVNLAPEETPARVETRRARTLDSSCLLVLYLQPFRSVISIKFLEVFNCNSRNVNMCEHMSIATVTGW